ncbi:GNAT family N-acetyltransferase [Virgibacillus sp. MSJ-26]|uniref:GNAT family N-acetyltransferase n=1 Tax=Virgibacillus sp. MSJ-26 TaxID=2841522 RepID=UPI001C1006F5|nr:GNAT family protein [Virgibacillus sp. MSJ-26]MBU5465880.1 GNAT family N-acetyltransferase [Virgibacillus sp. MSJ-26]
MSEKITSKSLMLEPLKKDHASRLFEVLKDPKIYNYIPENPPTSEETLANKFDVLSKGAPSHLDEIWLNYALYDSEISQYIGTLQATIFMNDKKASVAYILNSNYWGKGYATQALLLIINRLIEEYEIIEFEAYIDTRNIKSIELVKRLGFEYTGFEENADFFRGEPSHEYIYTAEAKKFR